MSVVHSNTRGSIYQEDTRVLDHQQHKGDQYVLRLFAPKCARQALAGQFVHIQCDPSLPLRRPLSIMRSNIEESWIDLLYKDVGYGTHLLANRQPGEIISLLGPIGKSFQPVKERPIRILIGGGVGIPPMIFLAETIANEFPEDVQNTFVIMGSEVPFPFDVSHTSLPAAGIDEGIDACIATLDTLNISSRLSSLQDYKGCYQGYAHELAKQYLQSLTTEQLAQVEIFSCGPLPMLAAVKQLAQEFDVSCQISLEETMACAVGGCAGCTVEVVLPEGNAMKRVCVDGPVFDARTVNF